jgi:uroporphyrinogen decarboxylase
MKSRERVLAAINHKEPDRVPYDLGSTAVTGIHVKAYRALRDYLGLPAVEPKVFNMLEQIAVVDDDVLARLKVDVKAVSAVSSGVFEIEIKDREDCTYFYDEYQIGWRMPKDGGLYYDMFDHPLKGNITVADVERFQWPDPCAPGRFEGLSAEARRVAEEEQRAVVVGSVSPGLLEMAAWLRGFVSYFTDVASNEKLLCAILDKVVELKIAYWGRALELAGDYIDVAQEADDFAGQDRLLLSPNAYRCLVKPRHRRVHDFIHAHSKAKVFFHSCGSVRKAIPDLIEAGVDILNPVQVSAAGMDSAELKREYGKDLVFWGGGVDTQRILPNGTPQQVREEVKRRLHDLMPGGGLVFNPVHNIQADVPPENIIAMWNTLQEYGVY